jgi:hypothetical protein
LTSVTQKVLPMFPVNSVTYVSGCTETAADLRGRTSNCHPGIPQAGSL